MDLDELERLLREATAGPWVAERWQDADEDIDGFSLVAARALLPLNSAVGSLEECAANAQLIAALRNSAEELIRDARACAEIRRVIALGVDDARVGRIARRAIAQEGKG